MSRLLFENQIPQQHYQERNIDPKSNTYTMQQSSFSPGKQPNKFVSRPQQSARMPFVQSSSASSQGQQEKLADLNSRAAAVLGVAPVQKGKPPIWAASTNASGSELIRSGGQGNPFAATSIEASNNHQLAGRGIRAPDLCRGLALVGSSSINGLGLNPNAALNIGSLQAIEQRPIKPAIKSAKHIIRPPQHKKATNSQKQRRRFISEGYESRGEQYSDCKGPSVQGFQISSSDRAEAKQFTYKPKINDMSKSPFLAPVISQVTYQQSLSRLGSNQKAYPKFLDKIFVQQFQERRMPQEEILPLLDGQIGINGLILPPHKQGKKLRLMKQKSDKVQCQVDDPFGQRGQSNPAVGCNSMTLGVQGSQMLKQGETLQAQENLRFQMSNSATIQMYKAKSEQKRFYMNLGYPDLRAALLRRGWVETNNKHDETVDLKFTLSSSDIEHHRLAPGALINHCRAEGSMTCKTALIETLTDAQHYWASWLTDKETGCANISLVDFERSGIDSFFPKSFIISNIQDQALCFEEMVFIASESYLKQFLQAFEREPGFKNPSGVYVKEKLMVCAHLQQRRLTTKKADESLNIKGEKCYTGQHLTLQEHAFILRGGYPESYIKFIQREDWFLHIQKSLHQYFVKDKSLKTKEARQISLWANIYTFIKSLLGETRQLFVQADLNGTQNLWIVKPGGLSRGRKIKIFDNYADICRHAELPYIQNPNGMQAFDLNSQLKSEQPSWTQKSWVAQKYIENPLIILNRKFDIRVWVVVSSWNPLKVYYYTDCYVRFAGQDYDTKKIDNAFSHLTNNAVTAKQIRIGGDKNYDKIPGNMWYLQQLKDYLNERKRKINDSAKKKLAAQQSRSSDEETKEQTVTTATPTQDATQEGEADKATSQDEQTEVSSPQPQPKKVDEEGFEDVWDTKLVNQLKDIIRITFVSGWGYVEWREGSVGIYGLDIMVDQDLKMWLIEVNKSPCMSYSTEVTRTLIPLFMEDLAKVMVDLPEQQKRNKELKKAGQEISASQKQYNTGKLELLLQCPFVKEPLQEIRSGEEYTVHGQRIANPNPKVEKGKYPAGNKH